LRSFEKTKTPVLAGVFEEWIIFALLQFSGEIEIWIRKIPRHEAEFFGDIN